MNTFYPILPSAIAALLGFLGGCGTVTPAAEEQAGVKGAVVEEVRNEHAAFLVRVEVDHADRTYATGDTMTVTVQSGKAGYLYLFYFMADGKVSCLFPNEFQKDNHIEAHQNTVVPPPQGRFRIRIGPPFGDEILKAVVSLEPLSQFDKDAMTKAPMTDVGTRGIRGAYAEQLRSNPAKWAEHDVRIKTVGDTRGLTRGPARRVAVVVGIGEFQDRRIRPLKAAPKDARAMADVLRNQCGVEQVFLLVDKEATLANIRDAICRRAVELTSPGDTLYIAISTHGGRCADDNGDEEDGYDEFLVCHDTNLEDITTIRQTVLLDDAMGRWIQSLDGRRVVVILDTCHSAGQATGQKSIESDEFAQLREFAKYVPVPGVPALAKTHFLDGELARTKDIGQKEVVLLAAAEATQLAFERRDRDHSVMTGCLLEKIKSSKGSLTIQEAYEHVRREVPKYVEKAFPGTTQTPVLVDMATPPVYLRP